MVIVSVMSSVLFILIVVLIMRSCVRPPRVLIDVLKSLNHTNPATAMKRV